MRRVDAMRYTAMLCLLLLTPSFCAATCLSGFSVEGGTFTEDGCLVSIRPFSSGTWARAEWQSQLPSNFSLHVEFSRPSTNTGCDQMGFIIGGSASSGATATGGIRVLAMSSAGWCDHLGVPFDPGNPGRLVVEDASSDPVSAESMYLWDTTYWDLNDPLSVTVTYDGWSIGVWANSLFVGSFPFVFAGDRRLTLVAFDEDETSVFTNLSVELGSPQAGASLWIGLQGRDRIRAGLPATYWVTYSNFGDTTIERAAFLLTGGPNSTIKHSLPLAWGVTDDYVEAFGDSAAFLIYDLLPGESGEFPVTMTTQGVTQEELRAWAWVIPALDSCAVARAVDRSWPSDRVSCGAPDVPPDGSVVFNAHELSLITGHMGILYCDWDDLLGDGPGEAWVWENVHPGTRFRTWDDFVGTGVVWNDYYTPVLASQELLGLREWIYDHSDSGEHQLPYNWPEHCGWAVAEAFRLGAGRELIPGATHQFLDAPGYQYYLLTGNWMDLGVVSGLWSLATAHLNVAVSYLDALAYLRPFAPVMLIDVVQSWDPNEKVGPHGYGPEGFISAGEEIPYVVFFENDADSASVAAREVEIADTLDMSILDISSVALGDIVFGEHVAHTPEELQSWSTIVDLPHEIVVSIDAALDTLSGVLTWQFATLDSVTGLPPEDPLVGFLPPNANPPEGEGQVFFTVRARAGAATGTEARNDASIVFDYNPPVIAPPWSNTIDADAPVTSVAPLDSVQAGLSFQVVWSGSDLGTGAIVYSVFVSEDDGAVTPWRTNTSDTSATFTAAPDHVYSFYSIGEDAVGNREPVPAMPDAVTDVPTGVAWDSSGAVHGLYQNCPNPFNPSTRIQFTLPASGLVSLCVYDLSGRRVRELLAGAPYDAGMHSVLWDGTADSGSRVGSGVYFYHLEAGSFEETRKMVLLK